MILSAIARFPPSKNGTTTKGPAEDYRGKILVSSLVNGLPARYVFQPSRSLFGGPEADHTLPLDYR